MNKIMFIKVSIFLIPKFSYKLSIHKIKSRTLKHEMKTLKRKKIGQVSVSFCVGQYKFNVGYFYSRVLTNKMSPFRICYFKKS